MLCPGGVGLGRGGGEFWPHLQQVPGVGHPRPTLTSSLAGFGSPLPSPHLSPAPLHPSSSHPTTSPAAPGRSSPNISLAPLWCVPPQPPPCGAEPQSGAGGTQGSHPTVATGPFFYFSVLWDLCSGGNACCCPCPFPRRQRSQETLQAPPHLWPRSRGRPSTSVFPIVSVKWG